MIPDESITSEFRGGWLSNKRSKDEINVTRWDQLKHLLQSSKQKGQGIRRCIEEIVFSFTHPRLDTEVSKHMNHLLKAPFCVHPKTSLLLICLNLKVPERQGYLNCYSSLSLDMLSNRIYCSFCHRVCVPINPKNCEEFDPSAVPTLSFFEAYY